ncbi:Coatomer subunit delta-like protein [Drosera capensis]
MRERMKEIDAKQRLMEKCYELMREEEMVLDEKLDKVTLKEVRPDETEAMAARTLRSSEFSGKLAKQSEEFELKDKSNEKELGKKMKDIELNMGQLKGKCSNTKDNGMRFHLLESMESKGEVIVDAVHPLQQSDLIIFTIEEKINIGFSQLGGSAVMHTFEVEGRLSVRNLEKKDAYIQDQVESGGNPDIMFKTHPKIDEALFASENILGPKDNCESFPISQSEDDAVVEREY